jgi:hypothetical protein
MVFAGMRVHVMGRPRTNFYAYGFRGWEMGIDAAVQTKLMFALADQKETQLAWYYFSETMKSEHQGKFDAVILGERKPDWSSTFGTARSGRPNPSVHLDQFDIGKLAKGGVDLANLELKEDDSGYTRCLLWCGSVKPSGLMVGFYLQTAGKRKGKDGKMNGTISFMSIERFSRSAVLKGPDKAKLVRDLAW